jgi:hypothetical protein
LLTCPVIATNFVAILVVNQWHPKKIDIEGIILKLFPRHDEINIHLIAEAAELYSANANDRRAIQQALNT